jgi:hypothetical protein
MKKTTRKLVVRGETLRVQGALDKIDLSLAKGGGDAPAAATTNTQSGFNCPAQAAVVVVPK